MTSGTVRVPDAAAVRSATRATYTAFAGAGFAFASWAARIPQVRDRLQLDPSELGLVLLAIAAGSVLALPVSGPVIARVGSRRTVTAMALLLGLALTGVAAGQLIGVAPVVVGLFLLGFSNGAWDVAMNVQGAVVERHLGRSIMSRFHAGFSLGTVAGAVIGAVMVTLHVAVAVHLIAVAVLVTVAVAFGARRFVADREGADGPADLIARPTDPADLIARPADQADRPADLIARPTDPADPTARPADLTARPADAAEHAPDPAAARRGAIGPGLLTAWREPRTLLIGVFVLAFAFAEGAGNDWISVAVIDGYGLSAAVGTLAFAGFLAAMTAGRWFGPGLLDRYGRVPVVRVLCSVGILGLLLFVFAPTTPLAFAGALLWGLGTSLGFPVGMSAGADDPERAAGRVSVIASIGYCAFLGGPPLVGFLGDHLGVLRALTTVAVLLSLAALTAGALRGPATAHAEPTRR